MPDASSRLSTALADRYRIERELGQGGMATVYLAQYLEYHRSSDPLNTWRCARVARLTAAARLAVAESDG